MKIFIPCMECLIELGQPTEELRQIPIQDKGRYEFTCARGHNVIAILQQQKFEILFEMGIHAILDGYYREAVTAFATSAERFYEFSIRILLQRLDPKGELFKRCWKVVSRQSERQLGAFVFLWASHYAETPSVLTNKCTEFRNGVIHRGRIPTKSEAIKFGREIIDLLRPNIFRLKGDMKDEISSVTVEHLMESRLIDDNGKRITTIGQTTLLSLTNEDENHVNITLEEYIVHLEKWRQIIANREK